MLEFKNTLKIDRKLKKEMKKYWCITPMQDWGTIIDVYDKKFALRFKSLYKKEGTLYLPLIKMIEFAKAHPERHFYAPYDHNVSKTVVDFLKKEFPNRVVG